MKSFKELRERTLRANLELAKSGLIILTWGNVSEADRANGVFAIKPSGVPYGEMTDDDIVVVSIETGKVVWGMSNPSSDTPTHLALYRAWDMVGGICHCHSAYATAWAQARLPLPCLGTTHADVFYRDVPVTRALTADEVETEYEAATGAAIVDAFAGRDPMSVPAVLVRQHGPFAWGKDGSRSVENAMVLEETARIAHIQKLIDPSLAPLDESLLNKHYMRKHGPQATYGQQKVDNFP